MGEKISGQLAEVGRAFLSVPFEPDGWDRALRRMASHTGAARGQLIAFGGAHTIPFNCATDVTPEMHAEFIEIGGGRPDVNWRVACAAAPLEIVAEAEYAAARAQVHFGVYDEFVERHEAPHGCQTVLLQDSNVMFGLATLRTRADGETTAAERAAFAEIAPYALAAVRMQYALESQGTALIAGAFEAMDAAVLVCDMRGQVCATTPAAERMLAAGCGLKIAQGRLAARRPDEDRELQLGLAAALDAGEQPSAAVARLWLRGDEGPLSGLLCEIFGLPKREWGFGFELGALVILRRPADMGEMHRRLIRDMLDLTSAEADIAVLAGKGLAREEIAERRGTSFETVNAQMKGLFRKADVHREAQLVALINRLVRSAGV